MGRQETASSRRSRGAKRLPAAEGVGAQETASSRRIQGAKRPPAVEEVGAPRGRQQSKESGRQEAASSRRSQGSGLSKGSQAENRTLPAAPRSLSPPVPWLVFLPPSSPMSTIMVIILYQCRCWSVGVVRETTCNRYAEADRETVNSMCDEADSCADDGEGLLPSSSAVCLLQLPSHPNFSLANRTGTRR